jgi:hypothetical protein
MDLEDLRAFEADTAALVPGFQLGWKDQSRTQKFLGWAAKLFNPEYLSRYTTTVYPKVWFPTQAFYEKDPTHSFVILAHERAHLLDTKASPVWFRFSYAAPQILVLPLLLLGVVLAFLVGWWALPLFVLALACLGPWPAPGRVHWEERGYAMTMATTFWLTGNIPSPMKDSIRNQFLGMAYFRMAWGSTSVNEWLDATERAIRNGTLASGDEVYGAVLRFLRTRGKTTA